MSLKIMEDKIKENNAGSNSSAEALSGEKVIELKESEYKRLCDEAAQFKDYKDKYVRLYADFENARKRMERERGEFVKYANEELLVKFLGILDDLERSVEAAKVKHEDYDAFLKGIEIVMSHIHDIFKKNGVKAMEVKGKPFDPHCHEILMQEERSDCEDGIVLEEFQKGYLLGERVVRTAKVKVAKKK